jgi:glyoxylase-like metal-dependent hydrolase (beta-lactamase superfamily II)
VWLPSDGILIAGDLVQRGPPSAAHAALGPWIATLDSLAALGPRRIVPGHGRIETDASSILALGGVLRDLRSQVARAVAHGESIEEGRRHIKLDAARETLAGRDKFARFFFDGWFAGPALIAAWREASVARPPPAPRTERRGR